jgi:hypothetical protein
LANVIEVAPSARSKCRGCGQRIDKAELRFGERLPNPFADGDMTHWYHPRCAAYKRPDALETIIDETRQPQDEVERQRAIVAVGLAHRRLSRADGAERASSGRARCRHCRETIDKDAWRIRLKFYEDGMFNPSGNIHLTCADMYFELAGEPSVASAVGLPTENAGLAERLAHFSELSETDATEIRQLLGNSRAP